VVGGCILLRRRLVKKMKRICEGEFALGGGGGPAPKAATRVAASTLPPSI